MTMDTERELVSLARNQSAMLFLLGLGALGIVLLLAIRRQPTPADMLNSLTITRDEEDNIIAITAAPLVAPAYGPPQLLVIQGGRAA